MKKKLIKHSIFLEPDYDYDMIGICSHNSDYRIIWGINELLDILFQRPKDNFKISSNKGSLGEFPYYNYLDEENYLEYFFIKNKHEGKFLIPEKKQIDFFLFLVNNQLHSVTEVVQKLKTLTSVLAAYSFDPESFSSTEHLIFQ